MPSRFPTPSTQPLSRQRGAIGLFQMLGLGLLLLMVLFLLIVIVRSLFTAG